MCRRDHPFLTVGCTLIVWAALSLGDSSLLGGIALQTSDEGPVASATATELPDGEWLRLGGSGPDGPTDTARLVDPVTGARKLLSARLHDARTGHTATVLPDGSILVLGGIGSQGKIVPSAEIFDPRTQTFRQAEIEQTARAFHTTTLLTDGRLLISGGIGENGQVLDGGELVQTDRNSIAPSPVRFSTGRIYHQASLLEDGTVLIVGGRNAASASVAYSEIFDPGTGQVSITGPNVIDPQALYLAHSDPVGGAESVPVDTKIVLRFSRPLQIQLVTPDAVRLDGPDGPVTSSVVSPESGRLVFVTPQSPLEKGSTYTLSLTNVRGVDNQLLPATSLSFSTIGDKKETTANAVGDDEEWVPDGRGWKSDRPDSPWRALAPLRAAPGVTALAGQVLLLNGKPLGDVTLRLQTASSRSDETGRFLLSNLSASQGELLIDGRSANSPGRTYGVFRVRVEIPAGTTTVLPYTVWMARIDTEHAIKISSPTSTEVVVTTPRIPGLELHIPPHTIVRNHAGEVVTAVSITPIPVDRPPFPLPTGIDVPIYFTIQPGGGYVEGIGVPWPEGARLIYPNYTNAKPGTRIHFWDYDPEQRGWHVYGLGTARGSQIVPDPGVTVYQFNGSMINDPNNVPPGGGPIIGGGGGGDRRGDPVDPATGLFVLEKTDLFLPDVLPLALTRTYRQNDTVSRPFGIGSSYPYAMFLWSANQYQEADLILPDGARVHFVRISSGTGYSDAVFEHTTTPTVFYKSRITWNGHGWDLKLKDGTVYVFGENAPLQAIRDRFGNAITINHTSGQSGNVTQVTSPNGRWIQFTYDGSNRITQAKDNIGRTVGYTYDTSGRLSKVTDPVLGVTQYTYDTYHRMLTLKDARNIIFLTNAYDANGRVSQQTLADTNTYHFTYTVDGNGKVTQTDITDQRSTVERLTFNADGYPTSRIEALGNALQRTTTYTRQTGTNLLTSTTAPLNRRTDYGYDTMGNLTSVTRLVGTPDAVTTTFTYEPTFNQIASIIDPFTHTTSVGYDTRGNLTSVTDPLTHQVTLATNWAGQLTSITDALSNQTTFGYDGGDLTRVTNPLGQTTSRFVDAAGRLVTHTNAVGSLTRYQADDLNRVTQLTDAIGGAMSFGYDPNANLLMLTDARNNRTTYTYDSMDRVATRADPLSRGETYLYDASGNLRQVTDRKSQVTTYTYDVLNRLSQTTYADTSTTTYTYDAGDRPTQIVDSVAGTITRGYDGLDRLTSEVTPEGTVSYTYDAAGRRATMTVAGQATVSYTYDNADRLTTVTQGSTSVTIAYDAADRRTLLTLPNGIVVAYGYDFASQLTSLTYQLGANTLGTLTYTYDAAGNRTSVGGTWARTGLPQALASATYDAANQMTQWGSTAFSYDPNGNMAQAGIRNYIWDARNHLGAIGGDISASFQYDVFGRRRSKTVGGGTTGFLYDGVNAVQELSGGSPTANLLGGLAIDEIFSRTDAAGTRTVLADALGSAIALTDASGALQTQYTYQPFGKATASGTSSGNAFQFTGRENDGTGLFSYRSRYYSPDFQRFTAEDNTGFQGGDVNFYSYGFDNPSNLRDPMGESAFVSMPSGCNQSATGNKSSGGISDFLRGIKCDPYMAIPAPSALAIEAAVEGSFLVRASEAAFNAQITGNRMAHIVERHAFGSLAPEAGKFAEGLDIADLIKTALGSDTTLIKPGLKSRFVFEHTFGTNIGINLEGQATSRITIVVTPSGKVITAFPF